MTTKQLRRLIAGIVKEMEGENWNENDFYDVICTEKLAAEPLIELLPTLTKPIEQYVVIGLLGLMNDVRAWVPLRRILIAPDDDGHLLHEPALWALRNIDYSRLVTERYWELRAVNDLFMKHAPGVPVQMSLF